MLVSKIDTYKDNFVVEAYTKDSKRLYQLVKARNLTDEELQDFEEGKSVNVAWLDETNMICFKELDIKTKPIDPKQPPIPLFPL